MTSPFSMPVSQSHDTLWDASGGYLGTMTEPEIAAYVVQAINNHERLLAALRKVCAADDLRGLMEARLAARALLQEIEP